MASTGGVPGDNRHIFDRIATFVESVAPKKPTGASGIIVGFFKNFYDPSEGKALHSLGKIEDFTDDTITNFDFSKVDLTKLRELQEKVSEAVNGLALFRDQNSDTVKTFSAFLTHLQQTMSECKKEKERTAALNKVAKVKEEFPTKLSVEVIQRGLQRESVPAKEGDVAGSFQRDVLQRKFAATLVVLDKTFSLAEVHGNREVRDALAEAFSTLAKQCGNNKKQWQSLLEACSSQFLFTLLPRFSFMGEDLQVAQRSEGMTIVLKKDKGQDVSVTVSRKISLIQEESPFHVEETKISFQLSLGADGTIVVSNLAIF